MAFPILPCAVITATGTSRLCCTIYCTTCKASRTEPALSTSKPIFNSVTSSSSRISGSSSTSNTHGFFSRPLSALLMQISKCYAKTRARLLWLIMIFQQCAICRTQLFGNIKSEPGSFTVRGEKWFEQTCLVLLCNALPIVLHSQDYPVVFNPCG